MLDLNRELDVYDGKTLKDGFYVLCDSTYI